MNETQAIIKAFDEARQSGERCALATVVNVEGSAYRRPGARMLVAETKLATGTLSGGCLERDVVERALAAIKNGSPVLVRYDTASDVDIVWGLGMGCNGVVEILIEPLDFAETQNAMSFLAECLNGRRTGVIATVFRVEGEAKAKIGSRSMLRADGSIIGDAAIAPELSDDALRALRGDKSEVKTYDADAGSIAVFLEVVRPPAPLVVFGAGADTAPIVRLAKTLGWHVTVVDTQEREATRKRFSEADAIILCRPESVAASVTIDERAAAVVMTHNYLHDCECLRFLLASTVFYVGALGPKKRTERIIAELETESGAFAPDRIARLHAPVGLDIGAETPEEIALSIIAEIRAAFAGRAGGNLRERAAPIHSQTRIEVKNQALAANGLKFARV